MPKPALFVQRTEIRQGDQSSKSVLVRVIVGAMVFLVAVPDLLMTCVMGRTDWSESAWWKHLLVRAVVGIPLFLLWVRIWDHFVIRLRQRKNKNDGL